VRTVGFCILIEAVGSPFTSSNKDGNNNGNSHSEFSRSAEVVSSCFVPATVSDAAIAYDSESEKECHNL
jgi:hypothetical protein